MRKERKVLDRLRRSQLYREYEHAFTGSTKLPLAWRAMEDRQVPHEGQTRQNPMCAQWLLIWV
jgi:hypothetical protein